MSWFSCKTLNLPFPGTMDVFQFRNVSGFCSQSIAGFSKKNKNSRSKFLYLELASEFPGVFRILARSRRLNEGCFGIVSSNQVLASFAEKISRNECSSKSIHVISVTFRRAIERTTLVMFVVFFTEKYCFAVISHVPL